MTYCKSPVSSTFHTLLPNIHCSVRAFSETDVAGYFQRANLLGLLLKRSTVLLRRRDRIERLRSLMQCFLCLPSMHSELANGPNYTCSLHGSQPTHPAVSAPEAVALEGLQCPCPNSCIRLFMFGHLLRTCIYGWSHYDLISLQRVVLRIARLLTCPIADLQPRCRKSSWFANLRILFC